MSARSDYLAFLAAQGYTPNRAVLFEEGSGTPAEYYTAAAIGAAGTPGWDVSGGYTCGKAGSADAHWFFPSSWPPGEEAFLSTTKQTVLVIRQQRDMTPRTAVNFSAIDGGSG